MTFTDIWAIRPAPTEGAVIAGEGWRITVLTDRLLRLDNPYHCPHGRPTIITMTHYELDKKFKRIV